jgi:hypothetical protein
MLVDPVSRTLIANMRPGGTEGKPQAGFFVTTLPASENIANTSIKWAGMIWTQVVWPLVLRPIYPDTSQWQQVVFMHESFHRLQAEQKWPFSDESGTNAHMDTLEGRYLVQLEWRALARALTSQGAAKRRAIQDVLLFRLARQKHFPQASSEEREIEWHEGLAQYTGVKLATEDAQQQRALAMVDLEDTPKRDSFVRSFAYASGPAYGLLLDEAGPSWRKEAKKGTDLGELLAASINLTLATAEPKEVDARAKIYEGDALRKAEESRDQAAKKRVAGLKSKLIDGPVLELPLAHTKLQFNPQNLVSLGELGMVYPTARLVDDWGILSVTGDMLRDDRRHVAVVAAPSNSTGEPRRGEGWELELNPGWSITKGKRPGDFTLSRP